MLFHLPHRASCRGFCLRKAEGAKTMPRWAVGEATVEVCAGLRCRWPSRTGARGARRPGREQPAEAAGDATSSHNERPEV